MTAPMLRLGAYTFSLNTAAYQEFQRSTEFVWAGLPRFGQDDALQDTGPGADTITLRGVVFPEHFGGTGQLDAMRALGAQRKPQTLIDGRGRVMGEWVILSVDERAETFAQGGVARRQEFDIRLRRAPQESAGGLLSALTSAPLGALPTTSLLSSAQAVASSAAKGPTGMLSSLTGSLATLTGMASQLGNQASGVLGAVQSGMNAARTLQNAGGDAGRLLASAKSIGNIPSAMNGLVDVGGNVSRAAGVASGLLDKARGTVSDATAALAVRDSMITVNQLNVLAVQVRTAAQKVLGG